LDAGAINEDDVARGSSLNVVDRRGSDDIVSADRWGPMLERRLISSQDEWLRVRGEFSGASSYREFRARYAYNENNRIRRTGISIEEVLRSGTKNRRDIFETCLLDGRSVKEVNECAKRRSHGAEWDADIFIALFKNFIVLEASDAEKHRETDCSTTPKFEYPIPILRIFSIEKAREFYLDFLGFSVDWEHRFEDDLPVYMQVSRPGLMLHLSEHHGDACPGATVLIPVAGIDALHRELAAKKYAYARPGVEPTPWGARMMEVADPFGNRLRFHEKTASL
jgi:catechol 2,3-dioxygenase-like lactoylglutathione lyase family enzyme